MFTYRKMRTSVIIGLLAAAGVAFAGEPLQTTIEYFLLRVAVKKDNDGLQAKATFVGIRLMVRIVLWMTAVLLILSNLGVNITSLIASLGIGGLAVAFAVQNLLVDLFSSFSIASTQPPAP